jgi:hypothetical protein
LVAFQTRNSPPLIRIRSRQEKPWPNRVKIGVVSWTMMATVPSEADADAPCPLALVLRQLVGQDRDEDEVVDAEHHLHRDQGGERRPGGGVGGKGEEVIHGLRSEAGQFLGK